MAGAGVAVRKLTKEEAEYLLASGRGEVDLRQVCICGRTFANHLIADDHCRKPMELWRRAKVLTERR